ESDGLQTLLGVVDAVVAAIGLTVGFVLWRRQVDRPALEPAFLQRVWYWDDFYDAVIGRPGQAMARLSPAAAALAVALMVTVRRQITETVGIAVALATLGFAIATTVVMHTGDAGYQFVSQ